MTTRTPPKKPRDLLAARMLRLEREMQLTNARLDVIGIAIKHQTDALVLAIRELGDRLGKRLDDHDHRLTAVEAH